MKALVIANWKMNPQTLKEAKALFDATRKSAEKARGVTLVVAVPAVFLRELRARYRGRSIRFAAQDCSASALGAHTGELSLPQLKDAGASHVIIGHSERRAAGETDEGVRKKVRAALDARFTPIVCVGEPERDASGGHFNFVRTQLRGGFAGVDPKELSRVVVAYEPVWAIGKETPPPPHDIHEMAVFIRKSLVATHGEAAMSVRIIYGGSTNEHNVEGILTEGDVVGVLPGHVSIDPQRFRVLLQRAANC